MPVQKSRRKEKGRRNSLKGETRLPSGWISMICPKSDLARPKVISAGAGRAIWMSFIAG